MMVWYPADALHPSVDTPLPIARSSTHVSRPPSLSNPGKLRWETNYTIEPPDALSGDNPNLISGISLFTMS
jgi:hypothetical protein